jgi:peptide/bleomycin uptake transporter
MIREFFHSGGYVKQTFAYIGLLIFIGHSVFKAWLKVALNNWYEEFYDLVGDSEFGSGIELKNKRDQMWELLLQFSLIVLPSIVVHPVTKWIGSIWCFNWRVALIRSYLSHWDCSTLPIEGAAQRVHEDTQRFADGLYSCFGILLDSFCTLVAFIPVLIELGDQVRPPGLHWAPWLLCIATTAAIGGLGVSMIVGYKLVDLEVANQVVEAELRTKLVLLEQTPAMVCASTQENDIVNEEHGEPVKALSPIKALEPILKKLWKNYRNLYAQFALFNTWLSIYDQSMVILPYLLVAPLLFAEDPEHRITLGVLMKMSNAFGRCFDAMAVVSENWNAVNAWRSVLKRLSEFEQTVYTRIKFSSRRISNVEIAEISATLDRL